MNIARDLTNARVLRTFRTANCPVIPLRAVPLPMQSQGFDDYAARAAALDHKFDPDAYHFLREALDFSLAARGTRGKSGHVRGQELLAGFRDLALREFGPLAITVLDAWGIHCCEDVGDMVFNLIAVGAFGKTDEDTKADFRGIFDFDTAFRTPFQPKQLQIS